MKLGIVGGGDSGLFLASYLKRKYKNIDITIFDRNKSLGRKILASGNGKCNFSNYKAMPSDYNNEDFIKNLYSIVKKEDLINYFSSLGLMFYFDDEGRMYPLSNSSQTILNMFLLELKDTKIYCDYTVKEVFVKNNKYFIDNQEFDYIVLASGSNASIDQSKVASTYSYLSKLNLKMTTLRPSLVGYIVNDKDIKLLKGYRSKAYVTMFDNKNNKKFLEFGEVIFKEDGLSGIVIMNSSHYYESGDYLSLNLLRDISKEEFLYKTKKRYEENKDPYYYLGLVLHNTLISYLVKKNIITPEDVYNLLTNFRINIKSTYDFKEAQVCRGGIDLSELNNDFSLKKYNHIFALGELLDIDGVCGGYNLMFAFMSSLCASKKIGEIYENKNN
jgi:predicted Rossmann fold flavoprotein